jgi:excisionase family DNA binding protein
MMVPENGGGLLTVATLAAKLTIHPMTVRKFLSAGKIPAPVRIGRSLRWRPDVIDGWIAAGCPGRGKWEAMAGK